MSQQKKDEPEDVEQAQERINEQLVQEYLRRQEGRALENPIVEPRAQSGAREVEAHSGQ